MLNNEKYFNQNIINNDEIKKKLVQITAGIDTEKIIKLINNKITKEYFNKETFEDKLKIDDYEIDFHHTFITNRAKNVAALKNKYTKIIIKKNEISIIILGLKDEIDIRRIDSNQNITISAKIDNEKLTIKEIQISEKSKCKIMKL